MSFPIPRPGLVISYSYLWASEYRQGREEGTKDRPCAIVAARQVIEGREIITVLPVTHSPPSDLTAAIEMPATIKAHLGLDDHRSWIMVNETNDFLWPGPDVRPIPNRSPPRFAYGMLPPNFYAHIRDRVLETSCMHRLTRVKRSD